MKKIAFLILCIACISCQNTSKNEDNQQLKNEFLVVTDSISKLLSSYHYNPSELKSPAYLAIQDEMQRLAKTSQNKEAFINDFNALWHKGPFSHVRLDLMQQPAESIATYVDSLRVGDQSVSLTWEEKTAILTVTTMTGVDTKERVETAFKEIAKNYAEALVIDLRNNTGGTFAGIPMIAHILHSDIDAGMFASQKWWNSNANVPTISAIQNATLWEGWSLKSFWHDVQENALTRVKVTPMEPQINIPVYVLTSNKTASAAEMTVDALAHSNKVTIVGETTAGEMLSQKMFDLPSGLQLSLPIADYYSTRIGRIEGKGVSADIEINQAVALDIAMALSNGKSLESVMKMAREKVSKMDERPFNGEAIYLFGSINDWGKNWNETPQFSYEANGIFKTTATFEKGTHEFKIAPMNWNFDFGATEKNNIANIGQKTALIQKGGSPNLILELNQKTELLFSLDVSNKEEPFLEISLK